MKDFLGLLISPIAMIIVVFLLILLQIKVFMEVKKCREQQRKLKKELKFLNK